MLGTIPAGADVESALRAGAGDLLESLRLFDVYRGPQVGEGRASLAYTLRFRAPDRTLKDDPKNSNALFNRGIVKLQARMDVKGAVADWELLLKQDPTYEQADKVRMYMAQAKKHANIKPGQKPDKPAM